MTKNENINFYNFMNRQIFVAIMLFIGTGPGYILIGYLYTSVYVEFIWFTVVVMMSVYGYFLYANYTKDMSIREKENWLSKVRWFMFFYFSLWSVIFVYYVLKPDTDLHYIAIATQLGSAVVASTMLASQKKLVVSTVIFLMLPLFIYFLAVGEVFSYLLAFFTAVLTFVLLYAAKNTHDYLLKSKKQAYYDYLTGLGNRRYFIEYLQSSAKEYSSKYTYLLLIDLDYFKTINDTLGHDVGDRLLQEVSNRMVHLCDKYNNIAARLGGDEFCILSHPFDYKDDCLSEAEKFADILLNSIKDTYYIDESSLQISSSIGISIVHEPKLNAGEFLKEADIAMYEAKHNGRNGVILFSDELADVIEKKLEIERLLHFALIREEIYLNFQPQVNRDNKLIGCEVLVRWNNKKYGNIGPDFFIPIAENTGYIIELGYYILNEVFNTLKIWHKKSIHLHQISINISMKQLMHKDFVPTIDELFKMYNLKEINTKIIFEITETSTSEDTIRIVEVINQLKDLNIKFSIDDFGTGYSSLSYIRELPLYELKIDKSFIANLEDPTQSSLVKSIIDISKNLYFTTVAEGVETSEQKEFLDELGCDLYQGYLFYKPMSKQEIERLIGN
jgi:diguanylate cyclase (GGDEF)-like protein